MRDTSDTTLPSGVAGTATSPVPMQVPQAGSGGGAGAAGSAGGTAGTGNPPLSGSGGTGAAGSTADAGTIPIDAGGGEPDAAADAGPAEDAGKDPDERCGVAVLDPANPPRALALTGNLGTHDPTVLAQDGVFYLWHTGPRLPGKTSTDLMRWDGANAALGTSNPSWVASQVPGATDLWAPDLSYFGGHYHLYYSASTFGSNTSCIGHATRTSLASGRFEDQGPVICSSSANDYNAIDPNVIVDREGTPWLAFGSFWDGIRMVRLDENGARADDQVHRLASRGGGAIEAPVIVYRCGYYYLFVSFDRCCNGVQSTYNIRVGRSTEVLGPYVDKSGTPMLEGGGTLLVTGDSRYRGPGHNAVVFDGDRAYNVFHAYDAQDQGRPTLRIAELAWDADGWPVSGGP